MDPHPLITAFARAGQGQVFAFFDQLDSAAQQRLLAQAAELDLAEINRLARTLLRVEDGLNSDPALNASASAAPLPPDLGPAPYEPLSSHGGDPSAWAAARAAGEAALRAGRVAVFTVAGGQGTRLGYDGPKGTFPVTPVRGKSLFQVFAEKILVAARRFGHPPLWLIMTSHVNHEETAAFFVAHDYFGLDRARVHFFRQGRMPAVDFSGRILLEAPDSIALSPDGHGGALRALDRGGVLDLMRREGADTLSYFQVDNPLVRCIDPGFIGWHLLRASEMSAKMVPKSGPLEKVGHFCIQAGRNVVIEYSDPLMLENEGRRMHEIEPATGRLRFLAGSIGIHVFDREFIRRLARGKGGAAMPFHRADKKIATLDATGQPVQPTSPNGVKFELFVFDALPFARNPVIIETDRADDFSPVKNADGTDSPATARADQLRQAARWLRAAGVPLATDATGLPPFAVEISPLFADDEETFIAAWAGLAVKPPLQDGLYLG